MTTIILAWDQPHLAETYAPNTGSVRFTPTRRHWHGDAVVPVESVRATVDGTAKVELAPSSPGWCWRVSWHPVGGQGWSDHVLVPESETPIQYRDLVHVDPASLEPTATPSPAWVAELEKLRAEVQALPPGGGGLSVTDNGDGTLNIHSSPGVTDNGDGTLTIGA